MFNFFKSSTTRLSHQEAYQQLQQNSSIIVLDVRTIPEFKQGHIGKSLNVPLDQLEDKIALKIKDKNAKIFVICYSGSRSVPATRILKQLGYTQVYDIGGIASWSYGITR